MKTILNTLKTILNNILIWKKLEKKKSIFFFSVLQILKCYTSHVRNKGYNIHSVVNSNAWLHWFKTAGVPSDVMSRPLNNFKSWTCPNYLTRSRILLIAYPASNTAIRGRDAQSGGASDIVRREKFSRAPGLPSPVQGSRWNSPDADVSKSQQLKPP